MSTWKLLASIDKLFEVRPSELSVYMRPGERSAHMLEANMHPSVPFGYNVRRTF